jgi:hypothetical protein
MMINPIQLAESLRKTYVFRQRNYFWLNKTEKKLDLFRMNFEEKKEIPLYKAEEYIRDCLLFETSCTLRDCHLKSLKIDSKTAPKTFQILMGDGLTSLIGGESDD